MATLDDVIRQMLAAGMPPLPQDFPRFGKFIRFGPKKQAWYKLREYSTKNGVRLYAGSFGEWRGNDQGTIKIEFNRDDIDQSELDAIRRRHAEAEAQEEARRKERAGFAANRAMQQWKAGRATGESPYLVRKGVEAEKGLRFTTEGVLLVPMVRYDVPEQAEATDPGPVQRRLVGLQKIQPDGSKLFNKGMEKTGAACRLGKAPKDGQPILVTEGVATALSIRMATGRAHPVYVAFDAGSLLPVAKILRALYPKSPIVFCADDDAYVEAQMNKMLRKQFDVEQIVPVPEGDLELETKRGKIVLRAQFECDADAVQLITGAITSGNRLIPFAMLNAGRTKACEAAREVGNARVCWPIFKDRELHRDPDGPKLTDFNDLHATEGLEAVTRQITGWLNGLDFTPPKAAATKDGKSGAAAPPGDGGGDGESADWDRFWTLVDRFTLIYPTDTAYDHELGDIVKIEHMRLMFGSKWVGMWLGSKKRKFVYLHDVVFEPGAPPAAGKLNLFRGFGMVPAAGPCEQQLRLLHFLCGEDDRVFEWVLKWTAYPLQHPGAKMRTAIVMSGKEGTGKNLFFGTVRDFYGTHGGVITQRQLESDFQGSFSAKLFIVANEVVSRQEMRHHVGFLKNLITEPEIWINRKNRDERCEANHINLVFLSNELQPLQISPDDRRYMIIKTPPSQPEEFYQAVLAELANGGAAALMHYLLHLDLGDFNPHTKPIETAAKRDLIELGMNAPQLLWRDIHDEEIPLPYCPALAEHVYRVFQVWCRRNGEKMPARINRFIPDFMSMNGIQRKRMRVPALERMGGEVLASADEQQYRQVLLMGEPAAGEGVDAWVRRSVVRFAQMADAYCKESGS